MTRQSTDTCASCAKFSLREAAENGGTAQCEGFERPTVWSDRACVLWIKASDIKDRKQIVVQLAKMEKNKA